MKEERGVAVKKIDIKTGPKWNRKKSLKALVRIDQQIMHMTADADWPVNFLNWATTKQILEVLKKQKFNPAEKLNLPAHFNLWIIIKIPSSFSELLRHIKAGGVGSERG